MRGLTCLTLLFLIASTAFGQSEIRYLANEGVMVTHGDTKILIDPLYQNSYDTYQLVPDEVRDAIFSGDAPYDGVDAVFVSHHHGDHFSAEDMLRLLRSQTDTRLYAPAQAVAAVRQIASGADEAIFERVVGLDLQYGDKPVSIDADHLTVEAAYIPHSGWPTARTDVQNIAFRITLDGESTVLHLGDADARTVHFDADEEYWQKRAIDLALPPYWFFGSAAGIEILNDRIGVTRSIGIHVPADYSDAANIPDELKEFEIFTQPGEERRF
jgi:L-ascorbate metabolism protein UlaG (beta-lactamase superfamily)